MRMMGVDDISL